MDNDLNVFLKLKEINPTLYRLFVKAIETIINKNNDYAGKGDFYKNFRKSEKIGIPAWESIFIRYQDKVSRIEQWIKNKNFAVAESLEDTCMDGDNYLLLMIACYQDDIKNQYNEETEKMGMRQDGLEGGNNA